MRRTRSRLIAQLTPFGFLTWFLVAAPLLLLIVYSFRESSFLGVGSGPTLEQYELVLGSANTVDVMLKTLYVAFAVAMISTALAFVISYAITFRMSRRLAAIALGVVIASGVASFLVRIFAWGIVLGTNGVINSTLETVGAIDSPLGFLYFGRFAIGVTMVYTNLPLAVLIVYSSMQDIDPRGVEASQDLGAGKWRTLLRVVAPQSRVGLVAAFAVTAMVATGDFVTPRIVGGASGAMVGAEVQELAQTAGDLPGAAALALSFIALVLLGLTAVAAAIRLLGLLARILGPRIDPFVVRISRRIPAQRRISLSLIATASLLVYLLVPTILVFVFSFNSADSVGPPLAGLTTHWYPEIVGRLGFSDALRGTLIVASVATLCALSVGVPVAFGMLRLSDRWKRLVWVAVLITFVTPGALLGSALLAASTQTDVPLGLALTSAVHTVLLAPIVVIVVYARLVGLDPHLMEAARDLGATSWRSIRTITVPLLRASVIGAAVLGAAYSLDEVFVTQFTIGNASTIPVWLLGQARRGFTPGIYALGVLLLVGTLLAFGITALAARRADFSPRRSG